MAAECRLGGGSLLAVVLLLPVVLSACGAQDSSASVPDWQTDEAEPYPFTTPVPALETTSVDGVYTREPTDHYAGHRAACVRCPPYPLDRGSSTLTLDRGRFEVLHVEPRYRGVGHYVVEDDLLILFNDPACTDVRGEYTWELVDDQLRLEVVDDPCAYDRRSLDLTDLPWQVARRHALDCTPPDEEAAVTGHWPMPSDC